MTITLSIMGKGGEHKLDHDLNFQDSRYESTHKVVSNSGSLTSSL